MTNVELTFEAVDDLTGAYARGMLNPARVNVLFSPSRLGPLIELALTANSDRHGPLLNGSFLDHLTQCDLRAALSSPHNIWFDGARRRGFMRTVFDPSSNDDTPTRTSFYMAARVSAGAVGFSTLVSQSLAAAMREMESNIHEHSGKAGTGILAFHAASTHFEFVAADSGNGVLATLRTAPEFRTLTDHGRAMHAAMQEGVSKYGRAANRGNGFRDLFIGLANLNADLRFRSGDHALSIGGTNPELKMARLDQKPNFQGFLASVRCNLTQPSGMTH